MTKLKIGIIGCGGIANGKHMPSLKKVEECEMVAFCDIVPERAEKAAKEYGKTVIAFSGAVTDDAGLTNSHGIDAFFPVIRSVVTLDEALDKDNAYANLCDTAEQVFRLMK